MKDREDQPWLFASEKIPIYNNSDCSQAKHSGKQQRKTVALLGQSIMKRVTYTIQLCACKLVRWKKRQRLDLPGALLNLMAVLLDGVDAAANRGEKKID